MRTNLLLPLVLLVSTLSGLLFSCTPPPPLMSETADKRINDFFKNQETIAQVKGAGSLEVVLDGRRMTGSVDIHWEKQLVYRATVYSIIGSAIAAIEADAVTGTVHLGDRKIPFNPDSSFDSLPFRWSHSIRPRDFMTATAGLVPMQFIPRRDPDSLFQKSETAVAQWVDGTALFQIVFDRSSTNILKIVIERKNPYNGWKVVFAEIKNGIAHQISIFDDDRNYFSITYDFLKFHLMEQ